MFLRIVFFLSLFPIKLFDERVQTEKYPLSTIERGALVIVIFLLDRVYQNIKPKLWNVGYWNKICKLHKRLRKKIAQIVETQNKY